MKHLKRVKFAGFMILVVFSLLGLLKLIKFSELRAESAAQDSWKAPERAAKKKNPIIRDDAVLSAGKRLYIKNCIECHGSAGRGDGSNVKNLEKFPGDFSDAEVAAQTDGELFWKITEGRKPMPSFKNDLAEEERWKIIHYLRTFVPPWAEEIRLIIDRAVTPVLDLHHGFISENLDEIKKAGTKLVEALKQSPDSQAFPPELDKQLKALDEAAIRLKAASDFAAAKADFAKVSRIVADWIDYYSYRAKDDLLIVTYHKDKVEEDEIWVQREDYINNPYHQPGKDLYSAKRSVRKVSIKPPDSSSKQDNGGSSK